MFSKWVGEPKHLLHLALLFTVHYQGARVEAEQLGYEQIWVPSVAGSYTTTGTHNNLCNYFEKCINYALDF